MKPPLLLIGQGSHDDAYAAEFGRFVHRLRCRLDLTAVDVSGGYLERATPRLSDSVASLVARGHHRLVALPLSLGRTSDDLGAAMEREQQRHPTLMYDYGRPLGPDPRVLSLLAERLTEAAADLSRPRALEPAGARPRLRAVDAPVDEDLHVEPGETGIVLVGEGSTDPAANAEIHRVSRLFWETHAYDFMTVETAFVSVTPPGVPGGLERCRRLGARRVIVVPYLLFAGGMLERVWAQALAYGAGHPDLDIRCAEVIGDCEPLADVVIERYEEALQLVH
ncbi:sirohydrochlorin chelatase [Nonomuraea bangladeshensis]|jgi:sirohydrochlorin cobaltochelatase|uniref:sirohydrochlorin chelatase n=1 Tax=Nonomuraea bangladeshensis TaxID=404385 RepID=UPI003C2DD72F